MRNTLKTIIFFGIVTLCSACISSMKVKVDVLDRTKMLASPEVLFLEVLAIAEIQENRLKGSYYQDQSQSIYKSFDSLFSKLVQSNNLSPANKDFVDALLKAELDSIYNKKTLPKLKLGIVTVKTIAGEQNNSINSLTQTQINKIYEAKRLFNQAINELNETLEKYKNMEGEWAEILDLAPDQQMINYMKDNLISPVVSAVVTSNDIVDHIKMVHNGLFNDPLNSIVVQAPKSYWRKVYNKTVARNWIGNTDIAVVMETPGNFFIKGVRMDAENVTAALANTVNTGIQMLAKVNGLPVKADGRIDTAEQNQQKSILKQEMNRRTIIKEKSIQEQTFKLSAISIMDIILSNADSLESETGYKDALQQIQSVYSIQKNQLDTLLKNK